MRDRFCANTERLFVCASHFFVIFVFFSLKSQTFLLSNFEWSLFSVWRPHMARSDLGATQEFPTLAISSSQIAVSSSFSLIFWSMLRSRLDVLASVFLRMAVRRAISESWKKQNKVDITRLFQKRLCQVSFVCCVVKSNLAVRFKIWWQFAVQILSNSKSDVAIGFR